MAKEQTDKQLFAEVSMVDLASEILKEKGEPILYRDLMNQVGKKKNFSPDELEQYIAQLYTEINIDGRFICVGRSLWGLRDWYPIEQATDSAVAANVKDDYLEDDSDELYEDETDVYDEEVEEDLDELGDDFADDETEESFDGEEELEEVDGDGEDEGDEDEEEDDEEDEL